MDYRHLFRQMGIISRQAMMNMNHEASQYNLDNKEEGKTSMWYKKGI